MTSRASTFVLIAQDPRTSHRANEALRIALGVVAGENEVHLVLAGPAVHLLDEDTDDLVDGDDIAKFRAALKRLGILFHVEESSRPDDPTWNADAHPVAPIAPGGVAQLIARSSRALVF